MLVGHFPPPWVASQTPFTESLSNFKQCWKTTHDAISECLVFKVSYSKDLLYCFSKEKQEEGTELCENGLCKMSVNILLILIQTKMVLTPSWLLMSTNFTRVPLLDTKKKRSSVQGCMLLNCNLNFVKRHRERYRCCPRLASPKKRPDFLYGAPPVGTPDL